MELFSRAVSGVLSLLASVSLEPLAWALVAYLLSVLVYSLRLLVVARCSGAAPRLGLHGALVAHLVSTLVNNVTPAARAGGELARALLASIYGDGSRGLAITVVLFERVTEAMGVTIIVAGLILFGGEWRTSLAVMGVLLVLGVVVARRYWGSIVRFVEARVLPRRYAGRLDLGSTAELLEELMSDGFLVLFGVAAGVAVWVLDALRLYFVAASLGYWLGLEKSLFVSMLYLAAGVLAFTPGGLGIVEGGLTAAFITAGMPAAAAFSATLIERLISYGIGSLLGAATLVLEGGKRLWRALR